MRYIQAPNTAFGESRKLYSTTASTATANQTVFNIDYDNGRVDAYLNGVRLYPGSDFTKSASGVGTTITLVSAIGASNVLELVGYQGVNQGNAFVEDRFVVGSSSNGSGGSYSGSTTVFNTASNSGDHVSVYRNGIKLVHTTDYTVQPASSTVTLGSAASSADEITVHVIGSLAVSNFIPSTGGTFTGNVNFTGNVTQNSASLATTGKAIAMSMVFG